MTFREKIILRRRYLAFLFDFLISMAAISLGCDLVLHKIWSIENERLYHLIWGCAVFFLLITRDISGRSLGKRIFGLKILTFAEHKKPKLYQLVLRNILLLLIPIEIILVIVEEKHMRLGDYLTGTIVIPKEGEESK